MPENLFFPPEGLRPPSDCSLSALRDAVESGDILEAAVSRCGTDRTLFFSLGSVEGRMSRQEAVAPWISGAGRDISVLSRVGKQTCFTLKSVSADAKGAPVALLSRRRGRSGKRFLRFRRGCVVHSYGGGQRRDRKSVV